MEIVSSLFLHNVDLVFAVNSELTFKALPSVTFAIESELSLEPHSPAVGLGSIKVSGLGGDFAFEGYGSGIGSLKVASVGDGGFFVPAKLTYGDAYIKAPISAGSLVTSKPGSHSAGIKLIDSIGGEGGYGYGSGVIKPIQSFGYDGDGNNYADITALAYVVDAIENAYYAIVYINSTGQIVDTLTADRELIESLISSLSISDNYTIVGDFLVALNEQLQVTMYGTSKIGEQASVNSLSRVWVVNIDNNASSQYDNYGFNSYFTYEGKSYGLAEDGVYLLEGSTDNGADINSTIEIGKSNLGSRRIKGIQNVYVGVSSDNEMYLKVTSDDVSYVYKARSHSKELKNHRVDVGRGLRGNYFNFTLMNNAGSDFDLETITFTPIHLSRTI